MPCSCEFPGGCPACRSTDQAPLSKVHTPCTDPENCGDFCFGLCQAPNVYAQCDLENPEICEACQ